MVGDLSQTAINGSQWFFVQNFKLCPQLTVHNTGLSLLLLTNESPDRTSGDKTNAKRLTNVTQTESIRNEVVLISQSSHVVFYFLTLGVISHKLFTCSFSTVS